MKSQRRTKRMGRAKAASGPNVDRGVLVVEDDPETQSRLARLLTSRGHRVVGASSVEGAQALLRAWAADCVIVAEELPGGLQFATNVRTARPEVPVVLVAPDPKTGGKREALLGSMLESLAKPLRAPEAISELMTRIFAPPMTLRTA